MIINVDRMDMACNTHWGNEKSSFWLESVKERSGFGGLEVAC
jgi:hypothetical protein